MPATETEAGTLCLEPVGLRGGGEIGAPVISGDAPLVIGRSRECDICLPDPSVSRRHASLVKRDRRWFIVDLGGRHGTQLNGVTIQPQQPAIIAEGDFIRVGPYTLRVVAGDGSSRPAALSPTEQEIGSDTIVERVPEREMGSLAQRRLGLLIDGAVAIHQAETEERLAAAIIEVVLSGTGFPRAAVIRPVGSEEQVEVLESQDAKAVKGEFSFSRSLLREASTGQIARLARHGSQQVGASIEKLGITGALCAPIVLDTSVVGYIYVDSRANEPSGYPDAAGFCHAVSRMASLALSNIKRADLQRRQNRLEEDLKGARQAQEFLCPKGEGVVGILRYAMQTFPGRFVAGDLFDIFALENGRVGICFGDVTGQGATAAILMSAILSHLRAGLARYGAPAPAVQDVNRYIADSSPANMFASLWVGVFDPKESMLHYVDAGHGHWFIKRAGQAPTEPGRPGGLLIGIDAGGVYEAVSLPLAAGDRIILYSDGVIEQVDPQGKPFEKRRVLEVLSRTGSAGADVSELFGTLRTYAGGPALDDDTTVASIELPKTS